MKKSIFLFFAAILCATSAWSVDVFKDGQYIYYQMTGNSNWTQATYVPMFGWYWDSGNWCNKELGKEVPGTDKAYYYQIVPNAYIGYVQIMRMNGSNTSEEWNYSNKKGVPADKPQNCYYFKSASWSGGDLSIKTYAPPMSSVTLADNGTTVNSGTGAQADPYIIEIGTKIKVQASGTKAVDDPDAVINYAFKYGATSQDSETTTWEIDANSPSTTYAIELEGYTKVNTTSSEKKAATKLYYQTVADATLPTYQVTVTANNPAMGTVTGAGEYSEGATAELTATPNDGYKFVNWTVGSTEKSTNPTYSFMVIENVTLVANFQAIPEETVYFINTNEWTGTINAYAWTDGTPKVENAGWAGLAATKEDFQIGGYDVYSYTAKQGLYANVIFNGTGGQTTDLTWQAGKYYAPSKEKWYDTKEAAAEALATPLADETVYFVNNKEWASVAIYGWGGTASTSEGIGKWAGADMTKTAEQVAGFDVYSYTAKEGTVKNILFNYNGDENKTSNFVWTDGKYYYMGATENYAGGTKEEVADLVTPDPLATEVYLAGEMTSWGEGKIEFKKATIDATTASVKVNLSAKSYAFQLVIDGTWYGNKSTMKRGGDAVHEGGWSFEDTSYGANCTIVADIAGDYTFTWDLNTKKLTVAYPPLPKHQVTATVNPAETGTVTGIGEYEQGSTATLVAAPAANYAFKNWTEGGEEVSTEATYSFKVTKAVELVANFVPEETHEVTVSYLCGGNPIVGQTTQTLAVGITTPSTITAPAITNYKFDSWTLGTGVQSEDAAKNPIQITTKSEGEYTLAANYTKIELTYTVEVPAGTEKCYIAGDMTTEWSFVEMTKVDDTHFTITIEGATTEHKYKYAAGPAWAYVEKKADGSEADDRTYNANDVVKKWASVYDPSAIYLLMGVNGDWDNGIALEVNPHNAAEYRLLCQPIVEANDAIKVVKISKGNKSYCASIAGGSVETESDSNGNIVLADGIYDFYYKIHEEKIYIATATNCYTRDVTEGKYGTICLPKAATNCNGATFFEVVGKEGDKVFFDEVTTLEAGVPYIFLAEANKIVLSQTGESADEAGKSNSLQGTFTQIDPAENNILTGNYMVVNNVIKKCGANCGLEAYRAYFIAGELETLGTPSARVPGRRRVAIGQAPQVATGMENIDASAQPVKAIINGQLFILRGEKMYDAQGKLVK